MFALLRAALIILSPQSKISELLKIEIKQLMTSNKNIYPTSFPPIALRHVTSGNFGREYIIKIKIIVLRLVRTI